MRRWVSGLNQGTANASTLWVRKFESFSPRQYPKDKILVHKVKNLINDKLVPTSNASCHCKRDSCRF